MCYFFCLGFSYVYKRIQFPGCHLPCLSSSYNILYFSPPRLHPKTQTKSIYSCKRNNPPPLPSELCRCPSPTISLDQFHFNRPVGGLAPPHGSQSCSTPQKCPRPSDASGDARSSDNIVSLVDTDCQPIPQMASHFECMGNALIAAQAANTNCIHELEKQVATTTAEVHKV
jgi:hypothetical protein